MGWEVCKMRPRFAFRNKKNGPLPIRGPFPKERSFRLCQCTKPSI